MKNQRPTFHVDVNHGNRSWVGKGQLTTSQLAGLLHSLGNVTSIEIRVDCDE